MKKQNFLKNENGSMTLVLVLVVMSVAALLIFQASSSFDVVNKLHTRQRNKVNLSPQMHRLAQMVKQSFISAQIDPSCSHTGKPGDFKKETINGAGFCIPKKNGLCVEVPQGDTVRRFCLSTQPDSLKWNGAMGIKEIPKQDATTKSNSTVQTFNRIVVPNTSDNTVWRSCSGSNVCVRLVLCKEGMDNCNEKDAIATQIIRLGSLE